ncbi:MAG: glycosyltransferase family 4 protein, partial [Leptospirales bacterium]
MKKSRKVFMIGWEYPPRITGGLAIACRGIARSLSALGHRIDFLIPRLPGGKLDDSGVRVFAPEPGYFTEDELTLYAEEWRRFQSGATASPYASAEVGPELSESEADRATLETETIESRSRTEHRRVTKLAAPLLEGGYGDHIYREIHGFAQLAALLAVKGDYDLIHAHDWMTFPAALSAAHATGLPVVCHIHATEFDRSGDQVNQYIYDLERHALHACDHAITVSNYTRQILVDRYAVPFEKITSVHNAVEFELPAKRTSSPTVTGTEKLPGNADASETPENPRDRIVLFLGRITFQKGPDYFVRAARKVGDKCYLPMTDLLLELIDWYGEE